MRLKLQASGKKFATSIFHDERLLASYLENLAHRDVPAILHKDDILEQPVLLVHSLRFLLNGGRAVVSEGGLASRQVYAVE
jgi:hypothetical protein